MSPLTFPPPRNVNGDAGRLALLYTVATIRLCTIQNVMALFRWSYDKAARELARLVDGGLVEQVRPYAPRGEGSAPIIFIITATGANRLGDAGYDGPDLQRVAKNLSVFRRTVEANRPAQTEHRLWSATLLTFLIATLAEEEAIITDVRFDRERSVPVNLAPYTIPQREKALIGSNDAAYVPDFSFVASRHRDGARVRDVIVGEVETGFGERDQRDLAIAKAWKLRAVSEEFDRTRRFDGTTFDEKSQLRVVAWTRSAAQEQKFFDGAKSVFQNARAPFWITNGELLPLVVPTGTKKRDREQAVAALVANVQERVWRWLRLPSPTDRRRFVAPEIRHA